jgi:hypothetical protein
MKTVDVKWSHSIGPAIADRDRSGHTGDAALGGQGGKVRRFFQRRRTPARYAKTRLRTAS